MTGDGHSARLVWMLQLAMTALRRYDLPPFVGQLSEKVANLHSREVYPRSTHAATLPRALLNSATRNWPERASLAGGRESISEPQLDERLATHADSLGFTIDCIEQVDGKIDIHALDVTTRTASFREVEMTCEVFSSIVHRVQTSGAQCLSRRGSAPLLLDAHGGPR